MKRLFGRGSGRAAGAAAAAAVAGDENLETAGYTADSLRTASKLGAAVAQGDLKKVNDMLSRRNARELLHGRDKDGRTVLHLAAAFGRHEVLLRLLEVDAVASFDAEGFSPLGGAVQAGQVACAVALLQAGHDAACVRNTTGESALHVALEQSRSAAAHMLSTLVEFDAVNVNATDASGGTALLRAAAQGNTEAVRVLLSKGASPGLANGMGLTPLTAAAQTGNIDVVQPLAEACHAMPRDQGKVLLDEATAAANSRGHNHLLAVLVPPATAATSMASGAAAAAIPPLPEEDEPASEVSELSHRNADMNDTGSFRFSSDDEEAANVSRAIAEGLYQAPIRRQPRTETHAAAEPTAKSIGDISADAAADAAADTRAKTLPHASAARRLSGGDLSDGSDFDVVQPEERENDDDYEEPAEVLAAHRGLRHIVADRDAVSDVDVVSPPPSYGQPQGANLRARFAELPDDSAEDSGDGSASGFAEFTFEDEDDTLGGAMDRLGTAQPLSPLRTSAVAMPTGPLVQGSMVGAISSEEESTEEHSSVVMTEGDDNFNLTLPTSQPGAALGSDMDDTLANLDVSLPMESTPQPAARPTATAATRALSASTAAAAVPIASASAATAAVASASAPAPAAAASLVSTPVRHVVGAAALPTPRSRLRKSEADRKLQADEELLEHLHQSSDAEDDNDDGAAAVEEARDQTYTEDEAEAETSPSLAPAAESPTARPTVTAASPAGQTLPPAAEAAKPTELAHLQQQLSDAETGLQDLRAAHARDKEQSSSAAEARFRLTHADEQAALERRLSAAHEEETARLRHQLAEAEHSAARLRESMTAGESTANTQAAAALQELEAALAAAKTDTDMARQVAQQTQQQRDVLQDTVNSMQARLDTAEAQLKAVRREAREAVAAAASAEDSRQAIVAELDEARATHTRELQAVTIRAAEAQEKAASREQALQALVAAAAEEHDQTLQVQLEAAESREQTLQARLEAAEASARHATAQAAAAEAALKESAARVRGSSDEATHAQALVAQELAAVREQLTAALTHNTTLTAELGRARGAREAAEALVPALKAENASLRQQVQQQATALEQAAAETTATGAEHADGAAFRAQAAQLEARATAAEAQLRQLLTANDELRNELAAQVEAAQAAVVRHEEHDEAKRARATAAGEQAAASNTAALETARADAEASAARADVLAAQVAALETALADTRRSEQAACATALTATTTAETARAQARAATVAASAATTASATRETVQGDEQADSTTLQHAMAVLQQGQADLTRQLGQEVQRRREAEQALARVVEAQRLTAAGSDTAEDDPTRALSASALGRTVTFEQLSGTGPATDTELLQSVLHAEADLHEELSAQLARNDALSKRITAAEGEVHRAASEKRTLALQLEAAELAARSAQAALEDQAARLAERNDEAFRLRRELGVAQVTAAENSSGQRHWQRVADTRQARLTELEAERDELASAVAVKTSLAAEQAHLQQRLETALQNVSADRDELAALLQEQQEAHRSDDDAQQALAQQIRLLKADLAAQVARAAEREAVLEADVAQAEEKAAAAQTAAATARTAQAAAVDETVRTRTQLTAAESRAAEATASIHRLGLRVAELEELLQASERRAHEAETQAARASEAQRTTTERSSGAEAAAHAALEARGQEAARLAADLRTARAACAEHEAARSVLDTEVVELRARLGVAREETAALGAALQAAEQQAAEAAQARRAVETQLAAAQQHTAQVEGQLHREQEAARTAAERQAAREAETAAAHQQQHQRLTEALAKSEAETRTAEEARTRTAAEAAEAQAALSAREAALEQLRSELTRRESETASAREALAAVRARAEAQALQLRDAAEDGRRRADEVAVLRREAATLAAKLEARTDQALANEAARATALEARRGMEQALATTQEQLSRAHETTHRLESLLLELEAQVRVSQSAADAELGRREALEARLEETLAQRATAESLLAEVQGTAQARVTGLAEARAAEATAVRERDEMRRLWEGEVTSRNKLGGKVLEMEEAAAAWDGLVATERQRVAKALELKRTAETRLETLQAEHTRAQHRLGECEGELRTLRDAVAAYERGDRRPATMEVELAAARADAEVQLARMEAEMAQVRAAAGPRVAQAQSSDTTAAAAARLERERLADENAQLRAHASDDAARDAALRRELRQALQAEGLGSNPAGNAGMRGPAAGADDRVPTAGIATEGDSYEASLQALRREMALAQNDLRTPHGGPGTSGFGINGNVEAYRGQWEAEAAAKRRQREGLSRAPLAAVQAPARNVRRERLLRA